MAQKQDEASTVPTATVTPQKPQDKSEAMEPGSRSSAIRCCEWDQDEEGTALQGLLAPSKRKVATEPRVENTLV